MGFGQLYELRRAPEDPPHAGIPLAEGIAVTRHEFLECLTVVWPQWSDRFADVVAEWERDHGEPLTPELMVDEMEPYFGPYDDAVSP